MENDNYLEVDLADIYYHERAQFFSTSNYNHAIANELLDKIETRIIAEGVPPNLTISDRESRTDYYEKRLHEFYAASLNTPNRFALEYFFTSDNSYSYSHPIIITPSDSDYGFWFILKIRQFEVNAFKISDFLNYQRKNYWKKKPEDFLLNLNQSVKKYGALLPQSVKKSIGNWTTKAEASKNAPLKNKDQKNNPVTVHGAFGQSDEKEKNDDKLEINQTPKPIRSSPPLLPLAGQAAKSRKKQKPLPDAIWIGVDQKLKEKQWAHLKENLIQHGLIDKIGQTEFNAHFNGSPFEKYPINWIVEQYALIYLFDKLHSYINKNLYTNEHSIIIGKIAIHFTWKGKPIVVGNWRKIKSENKDTLKTGKPYKTIDQIINTLQLLM
jgi:hypothetical protein